MSYVIIGSHALSWARVIDRIPKDIDVFCTEDSEELCKALGRDTIVVPEAIVKAVPRQNNVPIATADAVYTIKLSHLPYDIKWDKHWADAQYLKKQGAVIVQPLYSLLIEHWHKKNGNKEFLSLKQPKSRFFDDHVTYVYDHDYLHELMAYPNTPKYLQCLKEGEDVLIDKEKFFLMSFEDQIKMFREEIGVIAYERWMVNPYNKGKFTIPQAWSLSVKKTVTSLTKGWASRFIIENMEFFIKPSKEEMKHITETLNK